MYKQIFGYVHQEGFAANQCNPLYIHQRIFEYNLDRNGILSRYRILVHHLRFVQQLFLQGQPLNRFHREELFDLFLSPKRTGVIFKALL